MLVGSIRAKITHIDGYGTFGGDLNGKPSQLGYYGVVENPKAYIQCREGYIKDDDECDPIGGWLTLGHVYIIGCLLGGLALLGIGFIVVFSAGNTRDSIF